MRYTVRTRKRHWPRRIVITLITATIVVIAATALVRHLYFNDLRPVSSPPGQEKLITIKEGSSADVIATQLKNAGLIRSAWAFKLYVSSKNIRNELEAGTYSLESGQSVSDIVSQLTHGKVATNLVTIVPGQRLDQIRATLIGYGFKVSDVDAALNPSNHLANPALVDKPNGADLEGYIFPDSYEKTSTTSPQQIIEEALSEMNQQLTPDLQSAFAQEGLSTYQGLIVASMVEQEVSSQSDRTQAAQVFITRLHNGMSLGSDVTAYYGAILAGKTPTTTYDSPYNTLIHTGLPPTPISNVSSASLEAVAHPATTSWLYFVTGDDGVTHFSTTLQQQQANTAAYCHKLCNQ